MVLSGRKGIFFSMTSLLIVGALLVAFAPQDQREAQDATYNRIQDLAQDRVQLEEQVLPIILRAYTRQSLNHIAEKTRSDGNYELSSVEEIENELNKCLGADDQETTCAGSTDLKSFKEEIDLLETRYAELLQHDLSIELHGISLEEVSPWELLATGNFSVTLNDRAGIARYSRTHTLPTVINIQQLIDPLSSTRRSTTHRIIRDTSRNWTKQTLSAHAREGTYAYNQQAPSYLDRLMLRTQANANFGIHSLIDPQNLENGKNAVDFDTNDYPEECLLEVEVETGTLYLTEHYTSFYRQFNASEQSHYDPTKCD